MASYKPSTPFSTALVLLKPTYEEALGVVTKSFPTLQQGVSINGSFKTYGGTERTENGLYSIVDTADVVTWYRPDITADCRIGVRQTEAVYEIISEPENVDMRNQYVKFKVRRVKGGA